MKCGHVMNVFDQSLSLKIYEVCKIIAYSKKNTNLYSGQLLKKSAYYFREIVMFLKHALITGQIKPINHCLFVFYCREH